MKTLLEFATDEMITKLLIKERAKYRRRNRTDKHHHLDKECPLKELSTRKMLSRLMPPRYTWVHPSKRPKLDNTAQDTSKIVQKALYLTIKRDRKLPPEQQAQIGYLKELDRFYTKIRQRLSSDTLTLETPHLMPIMKRVDKQDDDTYLVTCRPLSTYTQLEDKIILALTSRYLTRYFDRYLHTNILSYRPARPFGDERHHVTDFNDGVKLIRDYRSAHSHQTIYAADCDIKKFYDIIPHTVVLDCLSRLLACSPLSSEGKEQVTKVMEAYLRSYNFYDNVWQEAALHPEIYSKVRRRLHDTDHACRYRIGWIDDLLQLPDEERRQLGVPQGGALSLLVANIVLNDVDQPIVSQADDQRLFIRYCDDMILLHTDYDACSRLMQTYTDSLTAHGLHYHKFEKASDTKCAPSYTLPSVKTTSHFWHMKSHEPFLWGDGAGNSNRYVGFLGYEIRRDGRMRLRKSNIERFEEKYNRIYYALRRYALTHTPEESILHCQQVLDNVLNGVYFYNAFDICTFLKGSQFRHLEKLRDQTSAKLLALISAPEIRE